MGRIPLSLLPIPCPVTPPPGSGVGPDKLDRIIGILKAYHHPCGRGPFPTELNDATGELLRTSGGEFGVTTAARAVAAGRTFRCCARAPG